MTDREGASIHGDFGIPARAAIEFEISWKTKPDFVFALGVDDKDTETVKRAFRFEAWGGDLVIQRELEKRGRPGRRPGDRVPGPAGPISRPISTRRRDGSWSARRAASSWRA